MRVTHTYDWSRLTDSNRFERARSTTSATLHASLARRGSRAWPRMHTGQRTEMRTATTPSVAVRS
jgi:hypothetical protein